MNAQHDRMKETMNLARGPGARNWFAILTALIILALLAGLVYFGGAPARAATTYTILDNPTGGDCQDATDPIGVWNNASKTCTLNRDITVDLNDAITIAGNNITLDGAGHMITIFYIEGQNGGRGVVVDGRTGVNVMNLVVNNLSNGDGIYINGSTNCLATGNYIGGGTAGVGIYNSTGCTASGNTTNGGAYGFLVMNTTNASVFDNTVNSSASDDILVWLSFGTTVSTNTLNGPANTAIRTLISNSTSIVGNNAVGCGISASGDDTTVSNNTVDITGIGTAGIGFEGPAINSSVTGNTVTRAGYGISVGHASGITISGNTETFCDTGLLVSNCPNCSVATNISNDNVHAGIQIGVSDGTSITNSTSTRNAGGIYGGGTGLTISGNDVSGNTGIGMELLGCVNCTIQNNQANNVGNGFLVQDGSGNLLRGNTANNNTNYGIELLNSASCVLDMNTTNGNTSAGIELLGSPNTTMVGNTVSGNVTCGIQIGAGCGGSSMSGNTITSSGLNFRMLVYDPYDYASFHIGVDLTNTIDGKTIYYLVDAGPQNYSALNASMFYCVDCNDVTVSNTAFTTPVESAILFINSSTSSAENVDVSNADNGITLQGCTNSTVSGSNLSNIGSRAIWVVFGGSWNTVIDNTVTTASFMGPAGVKFEQVPGPGNVIRNNMVTGGQAGVSLSASNLVTVNYNTLTGNEYGFELWDSFNNEFYQNNIIAPAYGPCFLYHGGGNMFSKPASIGGNYWSTRDTPAEGCTDANGDSVCDDPYEIVGGIAGSGWDFFPWTGPSGWNDTAPPEVSNVQPSGALLVPPATVSADYLDKHFAGGIDTDSVQVFLDGSELTGCTVTTTGVSCPVSGLSSGMHAITGQVADLVGNASPINGSFMLQQRVYHFTWYDCLYSRNWVLMGNPVGGPEHIWFDLSISDDACQLPSVSGHGSGEVPAGETLAAYYSGKMGGPVEVGATAPSIVSQRIVWAGNSLEEVLGIDATRLSSHFYWTWYDQQSPGFTNWVLVANPDHGHDIYAELRIAGVTRWAGTIAAGQNVTPTFPGVMGGPVEVLGWTDASRITPAEVMASQRVLTNGGTAFNEVPGIRAEDLSTRYIWTWYDMSSAGASDWVLIANPGVDHLGAPQGIVSAQIKIAGSTVWSGAIGPGANVTPTFPGVMGGPVEVISSGDVIATQRVIFGPSFEEVPGSPFTDLASTYHWTWYDQLSPGMTNWVLVSNQAGGTINYSIKASGATVASGSIPAGGSVTPTFPGRMGGPVEVIADGQVMASQRVLYNGYFNEVLGTVLS